ncbi:flavoprotein [Rhodococcus sp. IEGM 1330]|uniref:flavoprotein n=1 Tax=Rhodococcus sp. IEGM 1330 TaxID=3082225 RepID=UPI00295533F4|nr:flavoprotein [Rhodococcus sp. IEGM 1330]MDV8023042.1 flavoprotein [Rhodococcus sp. IEGM 1330]
MNNDGTGRSRLLYVVTGGFQAALALDRVAAAQHDGRFEVQVILTRSAQRFLTRLALGAIAQRVPLIDAFDEHDHALHVELADWADGVIVHPATMDFVARLAHGFGNSPALLAIQCTRAPVVVCPSLPPGGAYNEGYRDNVRRLSLRDNVSVVAPVSGISASSGSEGIGVCVPFEQALSALADLKTDMLE